MRLSRPQETVTVRVSDRVDAIIVGESVPAPHQWDRRLLRLEGPPRFDSARALHQYLWQSAWRLLIDRIRRRPPVRADARTHASLSDALATSGLHRRLVKSEHSESLELCLNLLKSQERQILELVYLRGLGIDGAAQHLSIARGAANMRLVRARRNLAVKMQEWSDVVE